MALDFLAGCIGGGAGVLVGHPLDTVKVRLQVQDYKNPVYKGTWGTFMRIFREEGVKGLYKGVNSPLAGMAFINAIVFGVYGNTMQYIEDYTKRNNIEMNDFKRMQAVGLSGSIAGLAQTFVCSPTELAKIRLQVDAASKRYKSITDCIIQVYKADGLKGIYKGLNITLVREIPSFYVYFYVYERLMMNSSKSTPIMMLSGAAAGTASWVCVYPIDVIKTRMQSDGIGKPQKYRNSWHCLKEGAAQEGYIFLFRGLNSTIARAIPVNAVTFSVVTWILRLRNYNT